MNDLRAHLRNHKHLRLSKEPFSQEDLPQNTISFHFVLKINWRSYSAVTYMDMERDEVPMH